MSSIDRVRNDSVKINFESGVWNAADRNGIIALFAVGVLAALGGVLGILGHQGSVPDWISSSLPLPACALMAGVGGTLCLAGTGILIYKKIKDSSFQVDLSKEEKYTLKDSKKYLITAKNHLRCITTDQSICFLGSPEAFAEKIKSLEDEGYEDIQEAFVFPPPSEPVKTDPTKIGHPCLWVGTSMTVLAIAGFVVPIFYPFPYCWTLQTVSLGIINAVCYGIINDMFATRQSTTYFTLGHTRAHRRLLESDNPTLNALAWGTFATWWVGLIGGILMAGTATITLTHAINPLYIAPVTTVGMLAINYYAHVKSANLQKALEQNSLLRYNVVTYFNNPDNDLLPVNDFFERVYLKNVPEKERAGWESVGLRNGIGYTASAAFILAMLVSIAAARIFLAV